MKLSKKSNLIVLLTVILVALVLMFIGRNAKNKPFEGPVRRVTTPVAGFFS